MTQPSGIERSKADDVLLFWFGDDPDDARVAEQKVALWWGKDPETDRLIRGRFGDLSEAAAAGALESWGETPRSSLARILLVDQFRRNMFRASPKAFDHDDLAGHWCLDGIQRGLDRQLRLIERSFYYLPLEHSESLDDQDRCVALFDELRRQAPEHAQHVFEASLRYAEQHRAIIARFGRFPHRNQILGRSSTPAEIEFLKQPGSGF
jgi:uncharacterized protein (DUF924 family)